MKVVLQRVTGAKVAVEGAVVGAIGAGLCAFVAVERDDDERVLQWIARKILTLKLFSDDSGRLNRSIMDSGGEILLLSNFTVAGRVAKGTRPDFGRSASAESALALFDRLVDIVSVDDLRVQTGQFGADMQIEVNNDGPVTLVLEK